MNHRFLVVRLNASTYPMGTAERNEFRRDDIQLVEIEGASEAEILEAAADSDALLVVSAKIPRAVIEGLERCVVLSRLGAGTDRIDIDAATRNGIVVANVPDFCLNEQAEHTMALLLAWVRRLPYMFDAMQRGNWTARLHPEVHRLAGKTLGLVGFGASAQAVARRAAAFDLRLLAWVRQPDKYQERAAAIGVELVDFERLLRESDFVSLHLPLTAETRGILSADRLSKMKPTAVLVNTARGALVDENALVELLQQNRLGGAALDVFDGIDVFASPGKRAYHPLLELENVVCTPHCAGSSVESSEESQVKGARNTLAVLSGRWPKYLVNPAVQPRKPLEC